MVERCTCGDREHAPHGIDWRDPRYSRLDATRGVLVLTVEGARLSAKILRGWAHYHSAIEMEIYARVEEQRIAAAPPVMSRQEEGKTMRNQ